MTRRGHAYALASLLALAGSAAALAQSETDDRLVQQVRQQIAGPMNNALEHAQSNRAVAWSGDGGRIAARITAYPPSMQNGQPCRSFKYVATGTAAGAGEEITVTGLRCRQPIGLWTEAGVPDIVAIRMLTPAPPAGSAAGAATTPAPAPADAVPDPRIAELQRNLTRLAYWSGPEDGIMRPDLRAALHSFEADEMVPQVSDPIGRDVTLSETAMARTGTGRRCESPPGQDGATLVCGRRR